VSDEPGGVISLVAAHGDPVPARHSADHVGRGVPLGGAGGRGQSGIDDQAHHVRPRGFDLLRHRVLEAA
jgi:hypothetical protein